MSFLEKCHQILLFFLTLSSCENTGKIPSSQTNIAVLINNRNSRPPGAPTFPAMIKKSFEKIPTILDIDQKVNVVCKDLNSTFCDVGKFLSFVEGLLACDVIVVLLLGDCQCEKMLMSYLDVLHIKYISKCERPLFTTEATSFILRRVHKDRQLYLMVPADAYGVDFHQDFSFKLQRQKIKIRRTLWVGSKSVKENKLQNELRGVAKDINNDTMSNATFVLGFLHSSDLRLQSLVNVTRKIFRKQFSTILWIFPFAHLDFKNIQPFEETFQALAFQQSSAGTVDCVKNNLVCDLYAVLEKASNVLKNKWDTNRTKSLENIRNTTAVECIVEKVKKLHMKNSKKPQEFMTSQHNCCIDVLQLTTDRYLGGITSKRIATWNGDTIQPYSTENVFNVMLSLKIKTVFRVAVIEYFPYLIKHELSEEPQCPDNVLPCYGQLRKADNSTVINYGDKNCCSGWVVDILLYLTGKMSYQFVLYFQAEKAFGVYDAKTRKWNGMIQDIISGKADISVDLTIRPERCAVLDCSLGYLSDGFNAILKVENIKSRRVKKDGFHKLIGIFELFLDPFDDALLIAVLMAFNVLIFLVWATDKICLSYRNKRCGREKEKFTILESMSYVWATAFGRDVGDSKKPLTFSARYLSSWLAFLSLILVSVYLARLMAGIVKEERRQPFTSLHDPRILNNKLKLALVKGGAAESYFHRTRDPVLKQVFENNIKENLVSSLNEGIEGVKSGAVDGFLGVSTILTAAINQDPSCSLSLMGRDFTDSPIGFMFRKGWPWAEEFKHQELRMNEIKRNEDWWKMQDRPLACEAPSQTTPQLSIADMSGVFLVALFAIVYCCFCLIVENICSLLAHRFRRFNGRWNVAHA